MFEVHFIPVRKKCSVSKVVWVLPRVKEEKGKSLFSSDRSLTQEMLAPSQNPDERSTKQARCAASTAKYPHFCPSM